MKILIVKRDKIGDMLLTTPLLAHLRAARPDAQIHVLANDYNAWVLSGNPNVDRTWVYRRARQGDRRVWSAMLSQTWQALQLRMEGFDVVLVGNGAESPRAIARGLRVGASRTVAYCADRSRYPGLSDPLVPRTDRHESVNLMALAEPLGIPLPTAAPFPEYVLPEAAGRFAHDWLAERRLRPGGYIVLGLGARRPKKQPTTMQVLNWANWVKREFDLDTVFMWTPGKSDNPLYPGDDEVAQPVLDAGLPCLHPFRGALQPALGLIWHARTSLFPDSGLMHFAAASPGGVLGFFAETDISPSPVHWAPVGRNVDYLEAVTAIAELEDAQVMQRLQPLLQGSGYAGDSPGTRP